MNKENLTHQVIIQIQILQDINGKTGLAAAWPKNQLTYMSGSQEYLPTELLISWDNIAVAIQKLLNTHTRQVDSDPDVRHYEPVLEVTEFIRNEIACVTYEDEIEDNMPHMLAGPIYNKKVLHAYSEADEEARKL